MKKLAIGLMALGGLLFATSSITQADYPPGSTAALTVAPNPVTPGATVTGTITNCFPGEVIPWDITPGGPSGSATCSTTTFIASFTFTAPATAGSYTVTAHLPAAPTPPPPAFMLGFLFPRQPVPPRPRDLTVTLVVQQPVTTTAAPTTTLAPTTTAGGAGLPTTGSSGTDNLAVIAIGVFIVGAGLLLVSQVRRKQQQPNATT